MANYEKFKLGNIKLLSGKILNSAELAYKTYGKLNKNGSNAIILPTFYTGSHIRNEGFIGKNRAINPNKYFIVSINMFGNGFSSSPNNSTKNQFGAKFPTITLWDNIYCQHKLITEKLKIKKIALKYSIFKGISIHLLIRKLNIADIIKTIVVDPATLIAISILFDEPTKGQSPMH